MAVLRNNWVWYSCRRYVYCLGEKVSTCEVPLVVWRGYFLTTTCLFATQIVRFKLARVETNVGTPQQQVSQSLAVKTEGSQIGPDPVLDAGSGQIPFLLFRLSLQPNSMRGVMSVVYKLS